MAVLLTQNNPDRVKFAAQVQVFQLNDVNRVHAESFVQQRFSKVHNACIREFMPSLVTVNHPNISACVGIRVATENLFIEHYLDMPIEQAHPALNIPREHIVEVGNLVSTSRHATLLLFLVIASALYEAGFREMVFCATAQVATILKTAGADLYPIVEADGSRMGDSLSEWGNYYDCNPIIMRLSIVSIQELIQSSELLQHRISKNLVDIDTIAQSLRN